jgi:hypothetical protein
VELLVHELVAVGPVPHRERVDDDERVSLEELYLRPLMPVVRVLDREGMEREDRAERVHLVALRIGDVDPDEAPFHVDQPFRVAEGEVVRDRRPVAERAHLDHAAERTRGPW